MFPKTLSPLPKQDFKCSWQRHREVDGDRCSAKGECGCLEAVDEDREGDCGDLCEKYSANDGDLSLIIMQWLR